MKVETSNFRGHEAIRIDTTGLAAVLLPGLGGRVIALLVEGTDVLWHDPRIEQPAAAPRPVWWGGWKTWIAPQARWPGGAPPRDLDEGKWAHEVVPTPAGVPAVRMTSPVCAQTGLQVVREVFVAPDRPVLHVHVTLANRGAPGPVEAGIWEVIQLRKPAHVSFPVDRATFKAEGGVHTYGTERDSAAARPKHLRILDDAAGRRGEVRCAGPLRFKFGARSPAGHGKIRASMPERGARILKLAFDVPKEARYAHEASVEVYNSDEADYCEIEAHAPLATLAPGESTAHAFALDARRAPVR